MDHATKMSVPAYLVNLQMLYPRKDLYQKKFFLRRTRTEVVCLEVNWFICTKVTL